MRERPIRIPIEIPKIAANEKPSTVRRSVVPICKAIVLRNSDEVIVAMTVENAGK
jgi:hypothetical protein